VSVKCYMAVESRVLTLGSGFKGGPATVLEANFFDAAYTHASQ